MDVLKISSFCSGIGSPEFAIKELGIPHKIVLAAEIDKYARASYLANHHTEMMINDMTIPDYIGEQYYSDINISGLPCQAFSLAGKRLGELDPRGLLFFDFYRYVKNQQPKVFIIENVKGLLSDAGGKTFSNWLLLLGNSVNGHTQMFNHEDSLGYNLHWNVLNTKDYGLPQNRERVFLIGIRSDLPNDFKFPKAIPLKLRLKDILESEVEEKYYLSEKMLYYLEVRKERYAEPNFRDLEGFASCITVGGEGKSGSDMNLIKVKEPTKQGYAEAVIGDSINLSNMGSETRRDRVGKGIAQTLDIACNQAVVEPYCVAMRGRNPENKSERTTGANLVQTLEKNSQGTTNTLTSVQKDNLIVEPKVIQVSECKKSGGVQPYRQDRVYDSNGIAPALMRGKSDLNVTEIIQLNNPTHSNDRIYSDEGLSPTLNTMQGGNRQPFIQNNYRIRKLTPLECWRLQGFSDEAFYKAQAVNSNSQLYKQAGNSISTPVIKAIIKNLIHIL